MLISWGVIKLAAAPVVGFLRAVPSQLWIALAIVAACWLAWRWHDGAVEQYGKDRYGAGQAETKGRWDAANAKAAETAASAAAANRTEEQRRAAAQQQEIERATEALDLARADAARADRAAVGLRDAARAVAARCGVAPSNPSAASNSAPADGRVLAEVLAELDERAGALAAEADRRGVAGLACQRAYDALTPPS